MSAEAQREEPAGWGERFRRAPRGVLPLGGTLVLLGAVSLVGGVYLAVAGTEVGWRGVAAALPGGLPGLYLGFNLIALAHWAWLATAGLVALLLASSLLGAAAGRGAPAPLAEAAAEVLLLGYLLHPRLRGAFGWG